MVPAGQKKTNVRKPTKPTESQNKYGLRVIQPSTASQGNKSSWVKVNKVPSGSSRKGKGIALPTRTSPRKGLHVSRPLDENPIGHGEGVTAASTTQKISGAIYTRRSPRKQLQLPREESERVQGITPTTSTPAEVEDEGGNNVEDIVGCEEETQDMLPEPAEPPHNVTANPALENTSETENIAPPPKRIMRRKTIGQALSKWKERNMKLPAVIPAEIMRPVGQNSQLLITEEGCIVRGFAPLAVKCWGDISVEQKNDLLTELRKSFDIPADEHSEAAILQEMARFYRTHKYRLHQHFLKYQTKEEALANRPGDVKQEDWAFLCDHFSDPEFLKRSAVNKRNRTLRQTNHCSGSKSFARVCKEMVTQGDEMDIISLWYETHFNKNKNKWSDDKSEEIYKQLLATKEQYAAEGTSRTIDEIFDSVVPRKPGYVQGRGPGPKPMSKAHREAEQQRKEAEQIRMKAEARAHAAESMNEQLLKEVAELKARQDSIEESLLQKMREDMQRHFESAGININTYPSWLENSIDNDVSNTQDK